MKKRLIILLAPVFLTSFSCNKQDHILDRTGNAKQVNLNDTITLEAGDTAFVSSENMLVAFSQVSEDSRCPINANCIWAGDATMKFQLEKQGRIIPFELHTLFGNRDRIVGNYLISFVSLRPDQFGGISIRPQDYKASFVINTMPPYLVKGVVKDYTGLDGCGLVIELDNGKKLEPRQGVNASLKNKRVALTYTQANSASICMVGTVVDVNEIYELVE